MARNNAISAFLSLPEREQTLHAFKQVKPLSQEYVELMEKLRATRYPLAIKVKAERVLFNDYTHVDYKKRTHFLDQNLPTPTRREQISEKIGEAIETLFSWGWIVFLIILIMASVFSESSDSSPATSNRSDNYRDTFHSGGISGGNTSSKTVSNASQIMDDSGAGGYEKPR